MICGNNPAAHLTADELAMVDWFRAWLRWSKLPDAERLATRAPTVPGHRATCAHCANEMRGHASAGAQSLCHPDEGLDCYRLVTV